MINCQQCGKSFQERYIIEDGNVIGFERVVCNDCETRATKGSSRLIRKQDIAKKSAYLSAVTMTAQPISSIINLPTSLFANPLSKVPAGQIIAGFKFKEGKYRLVDDKCALPAIAYILSLYCPGGQQLCKQIGKKKHPSFSYERKNLENPIGIPSVPGLYAEGALSLLEVKMTSAWLARHFGYQEDSLRLIVAKAALAAMRRESTIQQGRKSAFSKESLSKAIEQKDKTVVETCSICNAQVHSRNMKKHLRKVHQKIDGSIFTLAIGNSEAKKRDGCPFCGVTLPRDQVVKHVLEVHLGREEQGGQSQTGKVECVICGFFLLPDLLAIREHIESSHIRNAPERPWCNTCCKSILSENIWDHLQKKHRHWVVKSPSSIGWLKIASAIPKEGSTTAKPTAAFDRDIGSLQLPKEFKAEYFGYFDPHFADKYVGWYAQENGRFGSLPLYDDYGDEGKA